MRTNGKVFVGGGRSLQREEAVVDKKGQMDGGDSKHYKVSCEWQEKSESEIAQSVGDIAAGAGRSELVGEPGAVKTEQNSWECVCGGGLHLRPSEWEELLELQQRAEDRYELVIGILVSRVGMGDADHTHTISAFCQLAGRTWMEGRRLQALEDSRVEVRSKKKADGLLVERRERDCAIYKESEGPSSSPSE